MTELQQATITKLRGLGYRVQVIQAVGHGIVHIVVNRKLTHGQLPLRLHSDGTYMCPWYDNRANNRWKAA